MTQKKKTTTTEKPAAKPSGKKPGDYVELIDSVDEDGKPNSVSGAIVLSRGGENDDEYDLFVLNSATHRGITLGNEVGNIKK